MRRSYPFAVAPKLGDLLQRARQRRFVGRVAQLQQFEAMLAGGPHRVLYVYGPAGIGKSALLEQFALRARGVGRDVVSLDGREHTVTEEMLAETVAALAEQPDPVLLIDGYELLAAHDEWFRTRALPELPAGAVVVLAGREPPAVEWRTDLAWAEVAVRSPLGPLPDGEALRLLHAAGVPTDEREHLLRLGRGHPLALALLADARRLGPLPERFGDVPEVVSALVARIVEAIPDGPEREALELCAYAWVTTPALLATRFSAVDVERHWAWLGTLPYVVTTEAGRFPHDLARDVLQAELERHDPGGRRRAHRAIQRFIAQLRQTNPDVRVEEIACHKIFLHRRNLLFAEMLNQRDRHGHTVVAGGLSDHAQVLDALRRQEDGDEAALAERWLGVQPQALRVIRQHGAVLAFVIG